jgi:hypothetical protein
MDGIGRLVISSQWLQKYQASVCTLGRSAAPSSLIRNFRRFWYESQKWPKRSASQITYILEEEEAQASLRSRLVFRISAFSRPFLEAFPPFYDHHDLLRCLLHIWHRSIPTGVSAIKLKNTREHTSLLYMMYRIYREQQSTCVYVIPTSSAMNVSIQSLGSRRRVVTPLSIWR